MSIKGANIALVSAIPEATQQCKPKSAEEIYTELAEARACYERGEYEDFDDALADISKKYGL